jgi:hypothetical protein
VGFPLVLQTTPLSVTVPPPWLFTSAFMVARVVVILVTLTVVTTGIVLEVCCPKELKVQAIKKTKVINDFFCILRYIIILRILD